MRQIMLLLFVILQTGGLQAQELGFHQEVLQAETQDGESLKLYAESHALLIGVSDYTHWPSLYSIPDELNQVEKALEAQDFNVVRLNNPNSRELTDGIQDFIGEYGYERENRLLIYFSGHGHSIGDKGFLIPADTSLPDDEDFRRKTYPMSRVMSLARDIESKHVLFMFDSCFSGSVFRSRNLPDNNERYILKATAEPVRQFITAGGADQLVPAKSTFTPAFVRAINGEGDLNNDGYVTGSELGVHLSQLVPRFEDQTPQYGKIKDYQLAQGDFVFFNSKGPKSPKTVEPETSTTQVAVESNASLEALLWQSAEKGNVVAEYQAYLNQYPNGTFAGIARTRINLLVQKETITESPIEETQSFTEPEKSRLTITTSPSNARVRIMNIVAPYRKAIELDTGERYDVLVTSPGYQPSRRWVSMTQTNQIEHVILAPLSSNKDSDVSKDSNVESAKINMTPDRTNVEEALKLSEDCKAGDASGCYNAGWLYRQGDGVEKDDALAFVLFTQACNGGNEHGCTHLGVMYAEGKVVEQDDRQAYTLYKKGCLGGKALGCTNLGVMYENGRGIERDINQAHTYYTRGCKGGDQAGCRNALRIE